MSKLQFTTPDWPIKNEIGVPAKHWLPDAILSTAYVRDTARTGLALPKEKRAAYWKRRRSFATRKLYEAGLDEKAVVLNLRAFARRVAAEADVRRVIMRVEEAVAADLAEAPEGQRAAGDEGGAGAGTEP